MVPPVNVGLVATGTGGIVPCTPLGSMTLIKSVRNDLSGLNAVIVGRSNIVGKPMCQLLLRENCTVTVAHSKSRHLPALVRSGDICCGGREPAMIRGDWIKPGAIVVDVGINRIPDGAGKTRLVGDVAFAEALGIAGAITPVPGGAGPMTIRVYSETPSMPRWSAGAERDARGPIVHAGAIAGAARYARDSRGLRDPIRQSIVENYYPTAGRNRAYRRGGGLRFTAAWHSASR